jgi:hypothetical protein
MCADAVALLMLFAADAVTLRVCRCASAAARLPLRICRCASAAVPGFAGFRAHRGCWASQCAGGLARGVRVAELVAGGNAATCGVAIGAGDELVAVTAIKVGGGVASWVLVGTQALHLSSFSSLNSCPLLSL